MTKIELVLSSKQEIMMPYHRSLRKPLLQQNNFYANEGIFKELCFNTFSAFYCLDLYLIFHYAKFDPTLSPLYSGPYAFLIHNIVGSVISEQQNHQSDQIQINEAHWFISAWISVQLL